VRRLSTRFLTALGLFLTAAVAGYGLSSSIGEETIRREIEARLGELMAGRVEIERVRVGIGLGLRIEGDNVRIYPGPSGPGLRAHHALAEIDLLSLLTGRFHLRALVLDTVHMRIERSSDGTWSPYPIAWLARPRPERDRDSESVLAAMTVTELACRFLLERPEIANRLVVIGSSVSLIDHVLRDTEGNPVILGLANIEGVLEHGWLGNTADISLDATFVGPSGRRAPLEGTGRKRDGDQLQLSLAITNLALPSLDPHASAISPLWELGGQVSGVISFETSAVSHATLEVDWLLEQVEIVFPFLEGLESRSPHANLRAQLDVHPGRVRLAHLELDGERVDFSVTGAIQRPLRESSLATLDARIEGLGLAQLQLAINALPATDRRALSGLLSELASGEVVRVGVRGTSRLSQWRQVATGELMLLPESFVLAAEVDDVSLGRSGDEGFSDLGGRIEWSQDRLQLLDFHGKLDGEDLPEVRATLEGFSHLMAAPAEHKLLLSPGAALPGLRTLWDLVGGASSGSSQASPLQLEIDALHHAVTRYPLEDARLAIRPVDDGVEISVVDGHWGGAAVNGEAVWRYGTDRPVVTVTLTLRPAEERPAREAHESQHWAAGRFRLDRAAGGLPARETAAEFVMRDQTLELSELSSRLEPAGTLLGSLEVDLSERDRIGLDASFAIDEADLDSLASAIGLPKKFLTGTVDVEGWISGSVERDRPIVSELDASIRVRAREGTVRRRIPVVTAVAYATEGFNPFADSDLVHFETMKVDLDVAEAVLVAKDFELDGPLRVYASGSLELTGENREIDAVVGVFILRKADLGLTEIPLIRYLIPGSQKGIMGAYFEVSDDWEDPRVRPLALKTLAEGSPLPGVVRAPFKILDQLRDWVMGRGRRERTREPTRGHRAPARQAERDAANEEPG